MVGGAHAAALPQAGLPSFVPVPTGPMFVTLPDVPMFVSERAKPKGLSSLAKQVSMFGCPAPPDMPASTRMVASMAWLAPPGSWAVPETPPAASGFPASATSEAPPGGDAPTAAGRCGGQVAHKPVMANLAPAEGSRGELVTSFFEVLGKDLWRSSPPTPENRWWTKSRLPLLCPLTGFPVCLLPYPPFKLRVDPRMPSPHRLVDGKFLGLHLIVSGNPALCGRELKPSDVKALDAHIRHCKLGPFRPGRAASLVKEALEAGCPQERLHAAQELEKFRNSARAELGRLRRVQESRLLQLGQKGILQQAL